MKGQLPDLQTVLDERNGAVPAVRTATATGTGIDCKDYDAAMYALQHVGAVSGTTPTLDGKVQESDDDSSYSDVTSATFVQVTATGTTPELIRFQRTKRYVRYVGTIGGTSPSFACSASFFGQKKAA